ncbi:glutathione S-transferase-like [Gigantopelta aegis]|uniref:glutathione S-transferase-like n=1 Tax=Gigantopelta aegis TaxID=1735272 RepID=UPI001B889354|nr:glutathione S-transferase-like [Gigantopelta aegis]
MASYKVYYFPIKARGEPIRLLLAYKVFKYEDIRVPFDKWLKPKPNMPFGSMPVLEEDETDILKDYPGLAKAKANVEGDANIAKWLAESAPESMVIRIEPEVEREEKKRVQRQAIKLGDELMFRGGHRSNRPQQPSRLFRSWGP